MNDLFIQIQRAEQLKPKFGEPCNHCGWCCLTEVCPVGEYLTDSIIPCKKLINDGDKYTCSVANVYKEIIGIGTGCCAKTQQEVFNELGYNNGVDLQE